MNDTGERFENKVCWIGSKILDTQKKEGRQFDNRSTGLSEGNFEVEDRRETV